jgi:hypothetical protein
MLKIKNDSCLSYKLTVLLSIYSENNKRLLDRTFKVCWSRDAPTSLTFNNCTLCPHFIYVFCIYLLTSSDLCHLQHKLIGFYNPV